MLQNQNYYNLSKETMFKIIEGCPNEIFVTDKDMNIIYVNPLSIKHYGLSPKEMIGKNFHEIWEGRWDPTALPVVYQEKRKVIIKQITYTGEEIISIDSPVFDENGEVEMAVCSVQQNIKHYDVDYLENRDSDITCKEDKKNKHLEFTDFITENTFMNEILNSIKKSANTSVPILIQGETGTGKSLLAKYIHNISCRKPRPFVAINCAAIPENLLESELFGYAPFAFSGANPKGKEGLIELAHTGTLFLDEIGELTLPMQAKILDVIENHQFYSVGGKELKQVDVRIIAATNQKIEKLCEEKKFREDLFWRLNIMDYYLPSLKERKEDIKLLANYFLDKFNEKYSFDKTLSNDVMDQFLFYNWPGNIRQLRNAIEKLVVTSDTNNIQLSDLPYPIRNYSPVDVQVEVDSNNFDTIIEDFEKKIIQDAYNQYKSSRKLAASLNISQTRALKLINKYCCPENNID